MIVTHFTRNQKGTQVRGAMTMQSSTKPTSPTASPKKVRVNNVEHPEYYVENNHPAIILPAMFGRVQEELARRICKRRVKAIGTKTEQEKYSSKYALTELLVCGECKILYRRCTCTVKGKKNMCGGASAGSTSVRKTATNPRL